MELKWNFGDRLRKIRREVGLSQSEFADRINVGHGSLANWESDMSQCRNEVAVARAIEREFGVPASWTLGLDDGSDDGDGFVTARYPTVENSSPPVRWLPMTDGTIDESCDTVVDTRANLSVVPDIGHPQVVGEDSLSKWIASWCAARNFTRNSTRQRTTFVMKLVDATGDVAIGDLTPEMVLAWWTTMQDYAPETRKAARSAVKGYLDFLVALGALDRNPMAVVSTPKIPRRVPKVLTVDQVDQLRQSLVTDIDRIAVEAMVGAGLRCSEVSKLRAGDFRPDGLFEVSGKGGHVDLLPIPERLSELVEGHRGRLVPITPENVSTRMRRLMIRAGLDGHSAHSLRRTFATQMIQLNDIAVVQAAMRHSAPTTTMAHYLATKRPEEWRLPA
jgi:integrase/recombinase XerD